MIRVSSSYLESRDLPHLRLQDSEHPPQATGSGHHHEPVHRPEVGSAYLHVLEHQVIHPEFISDKLVEQVPAT